MPEDLREFNKWARGYILRRLRTFDKQSFQRADIKKEIKFSADDTDYSKALNYRYLINNRAITYTTYMKAMQEEFERINANDILKEHWKDSFWTEETFISYVEFMQWAKSVYNSSDLDSERVRVHYIEQHEKIDELMTTVKGRENLEELLDAEFGFRKL